MQGKALGCSSFGFCGLVVELFLFFLLGGVCCCFSGGFGTDVTECVTWLVVSIAVGSVVTGLIPCNWFWLRVDDQLEDRLLVGVVVGLKVCLFATSNGL